MKKKHGGIILKIAVMLLAVYVAVTLVTQISGIRQKEDGLASVKSAYAGQIKENEEMQRLLSENNSQFMNSVARQKFGYVKPNERVYVGESGN